MFDFFDNQTLRLVNIPMSVVYSLLVLLIRFHFPKMFKGSLFWFLSLLTPAVSFLLSFMNRPLPQEAHRWDTLAMVIMALTYLLANTFLLIGWIQFYRDNFRIPFILLALTLLPALPYWLGFLEFPPHTMFSFFNFAVILYLLIYGIRECRKGHSYSSAAINTLYALALLTTLLPLIQLVKGAACIKQDRMIVLLSSSYMLRNSFVLFSIYLAVMHKFRVDHQRMLDEKTALMRELEVLSVTDALTGLYNRRGFDNFMSYEFKQAKRGDHLCTITIGDIDFFKKVNDRYGHDCGDYTIKVVSETLKRGIREQDCLARWGGEEFIIMQKGNSLAKSRDVMERIRKEIESLEITYENEAFSITMSFGIAEMNGKEASYDRAIIDADAKLYTAKQSGRNCIAI